LHFADTFSSFFGEINSKWVMMHKHTRKLARIPDEVRTEIAPYFFECTAIADEDSRKLPKLPGNGEARARKYVRRGLTVSIVHAISWCPMLWLVVFVTYVIYACWYAT
jgi:hypothetical protein